MSNRAKPVVTERAVHGPEARCMTVCDFFVWRGELSPLLANDVRRAAREHVRETGHPVEITTALVSIYKPGEDSNA
jgi:hypothetical protein